MPVYWTDERILSEWDATPDPISRLSLLKRIRNSYEPAYSEAARQAAIDAYSQLATLAEEQADIGVEQDEQIRTLQVENTRLAELLAAVVPPPPPPDITVAIARAPLLTSRTMPAVSFINSPPLWGMPGWANAAASLSSCVGAYKVHISPYGAGDPWASDDAGPTEPWPSLFATGNRLDLALRKIRECDATAPILLTLYGGSWWMKGSLSQKGNLTTPLSKATQYTAEGRVLLNHLPDWLILVDMAVALAASYGCRDFEIWNEAKGYSATPDGRGQTTDARYAAGTPGHADMGYSYFYEKTALQVVETCARLAIPRESYRIGGPYPALSTRGARTADAIASDHPLYLHRAAWGYANKAPIQFTREFLGFAREHNFPLDVLTLDLSTFVQDGEYPSTDPFAYSAKFAPIIQYWREALVEFGYDADMPIDFTEIYSFPPPSSQGAGSGALRVALWADCLKQCVLGRVRYPIMWGPVGDAQGLEGSLGGLITHPAQGTGGALTRVGEVVALYKQHFGPGQPVYDIHTSDARVDGLANATHLLLYSRVDAPLTVEVAGMTVMLAPYETKLLEAS